MALSTLGECDNMNESERNAAFPVHVDLGRKEPDMGLAIAPAPSDKKGKFKPRVMYPTLYIDSAEGMPALPKEGCMLVEFRRKRMSVEENLDGKETSGVTLEIRALCLPDEAEEGDDMESAMKRFAKDSGVADAGEVENDEESEDDED